MKRGVFFFLFILVSMFFITSCVLEDPLVKPPIEKPPVLPTGPYVTITADTTVTTVGETVYFTGTLHNIEGFERDIYCLGGTWQFGNGIGLAWSPMCVPYDESKVNIQTEFKTQFEYEEHGMYTVTLQLNQMKSNELVITVGKKQKECDRNADCFVGGCSGQVCSPEKDVVTTCEWKEEYACYKLTSCGCVAGQCTWENNEDFSTCLMKKKNVRQVM